MNLPDNIREIGERLLTQDNRCTSDPMFCVQEKEAIYGIEPEFTTDFVWMDLVDGGEAEAPADGIGDSTVRKSGIKYQWKTVMVALTEQGCKDYLKANGHNHRGETRIYVDTFNRCKEMTDLRVFLKEVCLQPEEEPVVEPPSKSYKISRSAKVGIAFITSPVWLLLATLGLACFVVLCLMSLVLGAVGGILRVLWLLMMSVLTEENELARVWEDRGYKFTMDDFLNFGLWDAF